VLDLSGAERLFARPKRTGRKARASQIPLPSQLGADGMTQRGHCGRGGVDAVPRSLRCATAEGAVAPVGITQGAGNRSRSGFGGRSWGLGLFRAAKSGELGFQLGEIVLLLLEVGLLGVELGFASLVIGKIGFGVVSVLIEN